METCVQCSRTAIAKVRKKYPSKDRTPFFVCGYHLRPYKTSEYHREEIKKEVKRVRVLGYAPPPTAMGYAPIEENDE